ncbi:hypothetical protein V8420_001646 [Salmonella enterica subsp. enterica]
MIISDDFLFCDRVLLDIWGALPHMHHYTLARMMRNLNPELCGPDFSVRAHCSQDIPQTNFTIVPRNASVLPLFPADFQQEEPLINYLNVLMHREMLRKGVTPFRFCLLQAVWSGYQGHDELAALLGVPRKTIWKEKYRLMTQLQMPVRLRAVLYGTRFCSFLQRTPFMTPTEATQLRLNSLKAGSGMTGPVKDVM